jgi:hypothetical protein
MQYMLIIALDETSPAEAGVESANSENEKSWADYTRDLMQSGVLVSGASLQPTATATTVIVSPSAAPSIVDGPYAETKEQFAGYYLIDVSDLDAALEWAKKIPLEAGSVEVRPVAQMPDASGTPRDVG